jgi:hypothetical protein
MKFKAPGQCPICHNEFTVSSLTCSHCNSRLEGKFATCKFCQLPQEQLEFLEAFVKCRGNIKDIEVALRISYPTVRNRLDNLIEALGYKTESNTALKDITNDRQIILDALERKEIDPQEAVRRLKKIGK